MRGWKAYHAPGACINMDATRLLLLLLIPLLLLFYIKKKMEPNRAVRGPVAPPVREREQLPLRHTAAKQSINQTIDQCMHAVVVLILVASSRRKIMSHRQVAAMLACFPVEHGKYS